MTNGPRLRHQKWLTQNHARARRKILTRHSRASFVLMSDLSRSRRRSVDLGCGPVSDRRSTHAPSMRQRPTTTSFPSPATILLPPPSSRPPDAPDGCRSDTAIATMAPVLSFVPFRTHYFFTVTVVLATVGWLLTFVAQAFSTAQYGNRTVGVLWFTIFLQLFLTIGVILTLATDSVPSARHQLSTFGAVALVFAVQGVDAGLFVPLEALKLENHTALTAMGVGYLLLAIIDILWVLYFTSDEDSLVMHVFNQLTRAGAGGGLSSERRRRPGAGRTSGMQQVVNLNAVNLDVMGKYGLGAGIGSTDVINPDTFPRETNLKRASTARSVVMVSRTTTPVPVPVPIPEMPNTPNTPNTSTPLKRSNTGGARSLSSRKSVAASLRSFKEDQGLPPAPSSPGYIPPLPFNASASSSVRDRASMPASAARVSSGINIPAPSLISDSIGVPMPMPVPPMPASVALASLGQTQHERTPSSGTIKASVSAEGFDRASEVTGESGGLPRARALHAYNGSPDDPEELSFLKGEILEIEDQQGKWWQAKKADGSFGIIPSNYVVML
ncbi:hypothetical protein HMN09_00379300 [Mycena chlorophos]|uniref:SH3 domain-containing protein n=1 Tax=Mycena chlorophos TaxID=658473 RepID=A0A8H6WIZ8_MYCCL|nr:hypothetical protein HMN09_00379300 [Mycena chlorophos]